MKALANGGALEMPELIQPEPVGLAGILGRFWFSLNRKLKQKRNDVSYLDEYFDSC
ncbi:unnamed protein product [marine sediment metagenome]|uniref:Uncharacterized protein n=1 Tax=marine sediment metagenome TaxID=412755 RepID=X1CMF9_9ZZZZ